MNGFINCLSFDISYRFKLESYIVCPYDTYLDYSNRMNIQKLIKLAKDEADKSSHKTKVGAIIFDKSVISTGRNQMRSVRSITKKFIKWPNNIHAEINAIIKSKVSLKGKSILVVRINKKGNLRLAKPCQHCQMYIDHVGITSVFYSTNDGDVKRLF